MAIHIPQGTKEFAEAVERLRNSNGLSRSQREDLATQCCKLCTAEKSYDKCDECFVGKVGELADRYKAKASASGAGMYTSGVCRGPDGKYRYTHNSGG